MRRSKGDKTYRWIFVPVRGALVLLLAWNMVAALTSVPQHSSARRVTISGYKTASGTLPDPEMEETLSIVCKPSHPELKITIYLTVTESPNPDQLSMIGSMPGVVDIYITAYKSDKVWVNFDLKAM